MFNNKECTEEEEFKTNEYAGEGGVLTLTSIQRKMEFNTNEYR